MEGKKRMRKTEYTSEFGVTVECVIRGVKCVEEFTKNTHLPGRGPGLFFGDSWFGSVKVVCQVCKLGHHACFAIKTAHSRTPKKFLEETMKEFPGCAWIMMEGHPEKEDVLLVYIGYTYNLKKVLVFLSTKWVGSTQPCEPYFAKFPDKFGNMCTREVVQPDIISNYFNKSKRWTYTIKQGRQS